MGKRVLLGLGLAGALIGAPDCPLCHGRGLMLTPDEELPARPCPGPTR